MELHDLDLTRRAGLPDALRVLLDQFPRNAWESHDNFGGMVKFWLERHLMFRQILDQIRGDTEALVDRKVDPQAYAPRLSRYGGFFLNQLHNHHHIEDEHYFPHLIGLEGRLERGFGMLDADHQAIDGRLQAFADSANAVLQANGEARDAAAKFLADVDGFERLLNRHLTDEEELVVPIILNTGFDG